MDWQNLESVIGLRLFLEFYNYYRRFIVKQLEKIELFTKIIKKVCVSLPVIYTAIAIVWGNWLIN